MSEKYRAKMDKATDLRIQAVTLIDEVVMATADAAHARHEDEGKALLDIAEALGVKPLQWDAKDLARVVEAVRKLDRTHQEAKERYSARIYAENDRGGEARKVVGDIARLLGLDLSANRPADSEIWAPANMGRVTDAVRAIIALSRDQAGRADEAQALADKRGRDLDNVQPVIRYLHVKVAQAESRQAMAERELREARVNVLYEVHEAINRIDEAGE